MEATPVRVRLGSALEWFVAALFLVATCGVGVLIVRELRMTPAAPVQAAAQGGDSLPSARRCERIMRAINATNAPIHTMNAAAIGSAVRTARAGMS